MPSTSAGCAPRITRCCIAQSEETQFLLLIYHDYPPPPPISLESNLSSLPATGTSIENQQFVTPVIQHIIASQHGLPKAFGARIPVLTPLNISAWESKLLDYHDRQIVDFLPYGWPVNSTGCLLYKLDLQRAYRQIPIDPKDYNLLGFCFNNLLSFGTRCPFGLKTSAMICQCTTKAVVHCFTQLGFLAGGYLNDFYGADLPERAVTVL